MFKNYLKVSLRNLIGSKTYATINIGGLSIGIACFILTAIYVNQQLSYDRFGDRVDDAYRLAIKSSTGDGSGKSNWALSYVPMGEHMLPHFSEIEKYGRITRYSIGETIVRFGDNYDQYVKEKLIFYADPEILEIFGFETLSGDVLRELKRPNTTVLTRFFAQKLFGDQNPIGKILKFGPSDQFEVVGILDDYKERSHFGFEALISYQSYLDNREELNRTNEWRWSQCWTYFQLAPGSSPENISNNFLTYWNTEVPNWAGKRDRMAEMQPLNSIHLESDITYEIRPNGNAYYVYLFGIIGVFILMLGVINYMNLATARSIKRMKEIGIRKVMGSGRGMLIGQFLVESIIIVLLATIMSVLWVELVIPLFSELAGTTLSFNWIENPIYFVLLIAFAVLTGMIAGSYPAFYLSSFSISHVFRNAKSNNKGTLSLRKVLVVFQFSITTILLLATFVVHSQLNFMFSQELGFKKDQVIVLHDKVNGENILPKLPTIKQELESLIGVKQVSFTSSLPVGNVYENGLFVEAGEEMQPFIVKTLWVDEDWVSTLGVELAEGRNFSRKTPTDSLKSFIINGAAKRVFGWNEAIGKRIKFGLQPDGSYRMNGEVIGVLNDFHLSSAHNSIEPLVMMRGASPWGYLIASVNTSDLRNTVSLIEEKWLSVYPEVPFELTFLDNRFNDQYRSESQLLTLFSYLSGVSVLIACLGLFGLAAYMAEQRTKEIGIRKVIGATVSDLIFLLSKDFLVLIFIAFIIGLPLGYFQANNWLDNFAFRVEVSLIAIIMSGLIALLVGIVSVGYKAFRAASVNPVQSLRME